MGNTLAIAGNNLQHPEHMNLKMLLDWAGKL